MLPAVVERRTGQGSGQGAGRVLGVNLRSRRDEQGISLSELARRSGIAKGRLSQLESGAGNPTIETVFGRSNALGVPVSSLLNEPPAADLVHVRSADVGVLTGDAVDLRMLRRLEHPPVTAPLPLEHLEHRLQVLVVRGLVVGLVVVAP